MYNPNSNKFRLVFAIIVKYGYTITSIDTDKEIMSIVTTGGVFTYPINAM